MRIEKQIVLPLACIAVLAGCNTSSGPSSSGSQELGDSEEINKMIEEELSDYFPTDFLVTDEGSTMKSAEAIEADRWRRHVTERSGNVEIEFPGDGSAEVSIRALIEGSLFIADVIDSNETVVYEKAFADSIFRKAVFQRLPVRESRPPYRRWALQSVSIGEAISTPVNSVSIVSVTVENLTAGGTYEFDDPSALLDRETEIPEFDPGDEIEVTVDAGSAGLLAYLHTPSKRDPMNDNDDGTYSGTWTVGSRPGHRVAAVDLLTEGTLLDDVADYDGNAWATHYRVH